MQSLGSLPKRGVVLPCGDDAPRPFLKWAGGKRQLLPTLRQFFPARFKRYFEPFLGSGAVFFDLCGRTLLERHEAILNDSNPDLVGTFRVIRDDPEGLIRCLTRLAKERDRDPHAHYYDVRDNRFNPARLAVRTIGGATAMVDRYTPELAAMLIYLNRTGFNGLFRQNAHGQFNVPVGRYLNPRICDAENLHRVAKALAATRARLLVGDFSVILRDAQRGDFLYFDPPYAPLSATASFTSYTAGGFGEAEQRRLQETVVELAGRGCHIVLSNSTAPVVEALYECRSVRDAGLRTFRVPARRAINSNGARRGTVLEYLITNVPPRTGGDDAGEGQRGHKR